MNIKISNVSLEEYTNKIAQNVLPVPFWNDPILTSCYENRIFIIISKGDSIIGFWIVPTINDNGIIIKRKYRFFPYSSPSILVEGNINRREIIIQLFSYLKSLSHTISLPMSPTFGDIPGIQGLGMFAEWRHTHIVNSIIDLKYLNSNTRNNIKYAERTSEIFINNSSNDFDFNKAIKGSKEEIHERTILAQKLLDKKKAIIVSGRSKNKVVCGIFIVLDNNYAYLLHSWKDFDAPRGIISLCILKGIEWVFKNSDTLHFDFEGSVIQDIDYFFSSFDGIITPYAYIHWSTKKEIFYNLIDKSINIEGRILNSN